MRSFGWECGRDETDEDDLASTHEEDGLMLGGVGFEEYDGAGSKKILEAAATAADADRKSAK